MSASAVRTAERHEVSIGNAEGKEAAAGILPPAAVEVSTAPEAEADLPGPGIYRELGALPPATVITENGLAALLNKKCIESVKRAVARGELPPPVKIAGKNCWTAGCVVKYIEDRLQAEARKYARCRPG